MSVSEETTDPSKTAPQFPVTADFIEPGMFLLQQGQRMTDEAQIELLTSTEDILGVTGYQLASLLGMGYDHYRDRKHARKRFGPGRWGQICKLLQLHARGIPLQLARSIYWKEGIINWRNGNESSANHLLERGWQVPEKEREDIGGSPEALTQWGRQAGPQPKRKSGVRSERGPAIPESPVSEPFLDGTDR